MCACMLLVLSPEIRRRRLIVVRRGRLAESWRVVWVHFVIVLGLLVGC